MISLIFVIALAAFLAGAATAVFLMLVVGIRKNDRPDRILQPQPKAGPLDACARSVLGGRTWPDVPVYRADCENDWPR